MSHEPKEERARQREQQCQGPEVELHLVGLMNSDEASMPGAE